MYRYGGLDLATKKDYSALVVHDVDPSKNRIMAHWAYRWPHQAYHKIESDLERLKPQLNLNKLAVEVNGPGWPVYQELKKRGLPAVPVSNTKEIKDEKKLRDINSMGKPNMVKWRHRAQSLGILQYPRDSKNKHMKELIRQNELFSQHVQPSGSVQYRAPSGLHDDLSLSELLCLHLCKRHVSLGDGSHVLGPAFKEEMEELIHV